MPNSPFASLVCWTDKKDGKTDPCIDNLGVHLNQFDSIARKLILRGPDKDVIAYASFVGRAILETGLTALRLRFDSFRSGSIYRLARHPKYDPNIPFRHRIEWNGDIFAAEKTGGDTWNPDQKAELISRALFSDQLIDVTWVPAAEAMLDYLARSGEDVETGYFQSDPPKTALSRYRGEIGQLYSFLSKGVHGEFFLHPASPFDAATGKEKLLATLGYVAELAFVARFARGYADGVTPKNALNLYRKVRVVLDD